MIVWAVMDVWSLNHFHTSTYSSWSLLYSSCRLLFLSRINFEVDKRDLSPWRGGGGGGGAPPSTLDGHSWGGGGAAPPPLDGHSWGGWCTPPHGMGTAGGVVHLPWSEGKLGVVDIQAFEVRDGALCRKKILARLGGELERAWSKAGGGWCAPLAWMKVDAKWRTLWCPSWSSWGGTLEFCEPYWIIPRIVTHQSRPLWECLPNAFLYFLTAFHHCTGVCIINGASTELSWQISCYIVDRAAEKIFNIFSLAMDFASLAGETTQNDIVRPKTSKKQKNETKISTKHKQQKNKLQGAGYRYLGPVFIWFGGLVCLELWRKRLHFTGNQQII